MAETLRGFLLAKSVNGLIPLAVARTVAERFGVSLREVELAALQQYIVPVRYQRNMQTITPADQLKLFNSSVAVVGCGGLGGNAIEALCRLGIGTLVCIDPDRFEEHNLNRQRFSTVLTLGRPKVEVIAETLPLINPAVHVVAHYLALAPENASDLLCGCSVVIDGLDATAVRRDLAQVCADLSTPLVHASIAGWYGQIAVQIPGSPSALNLAALFPNKPGIEQTLGNPSFTPAFIGALEAAEACKIILGKSSALAERMLFADLLELSFTSLGR